MIKRLELTVAGLILMCAAPASAQKLDVKIVDRQDKEGEYDYAAVFNNVAVAKTFKVHGATFTLQLAPGEVMRIDRNDANYIDKEGFIVSYESLSGKKYRTISRMVNGALNVQFERI
jgi:hypothetical protein